MKFLKNIRDPIHDFIGITQNEMDILDSSEMQRLRRIKQLANAHLLYPGANHTRFEHSLGCMHLSWRIGKKIELSDNNLEILRISALVHDIGHGPYSHPFEDSMKELGVDYDHDKLRIEIISKNTNVIKDEERRSSVVKFLEYVNDDLEEKDVEDEKQWPAMRSILSSPVDADKMDYILRDGYYCGVNYGKFDLPRILLKIRGYVDNPVGTLYYGICSSAHDAAVMVWISRLMMNRQVYLHKVRAISDLMTKRMISLAHQNSFLKDIASPIGIYGELKDYSDYSLMDRMIKDSYDEYSTFYARSLKDRHLFKMVEMRPVDIISETNKKRIIKYSKSKDMLGRRQFFRDFEKILAEKIGMDPELVIIDHHMGHVKKPKGEFLVIDKDTGERRNFFEESPVDQKEEDHGKDNILILVPNENIEEARKCVADIII